MKVYIIMSGLLLDHTSVSSEVDVRIEGVFTSRELADEYVYNSDYEDRLCWCETWEVQGG